MKTWVPIFLRTKWNFGRKSRPIRLSIGYFINYFLDKNCRSNGTIALEELRAING